MAGLPSQLKAIIRGASRLRRLINEEAIPLQSRAMSVYADHINPTTAALPLQLSAILTVWMRALHSCILYPTSASVVKSMDAFLRDSTMTDPNVVLSGWVYSVSSRYESSLTKSRREPYRWSDLSAADQVLDIADLPNDSYDHISVCRILSRYNRESDHVACLPALHHRP